MSPTGYGVQTKLFAPRLQGLGHDVAFATNHGLERGMLTWPGPRGPMMMFPKGEDIFSRDVLEDHAKTFQADAIVQLYDAWIYQNPTNIPRASWFPVDMEPVAEVVLDSVRRSTMRIAMSRSGQDAILDREMDCEYVPHAFDGKTFYYDDDGGAFRNMVRAEGKFLVGVVAANNYVPPRKCWPQLFEGFSQFHVKHPDSVLYVHSDHDDRHQGVELVKLAGFYNIPEEAIAFCNPYNYTVGFNDEYMRKMYSSLDVLLLVSMGEGFGVPLIEAQACGTPVITGEWTAMGENRRSGSLIYRDEAFRYHVAGWSNQYLPRPEAIADRLAEMLNFGMTREYVAGRVQDFEADYVTETFWKPVLDKLEVRIKRPEPFVLRVA